MIASVTAFVSAVIGTALVCYGIFLLAGLGWALIVAAVPFLGMAAVILRGLLHGK